MSESINVMSELIDTFYDEVTSPIGANRPLKSILL